MGASRLDAAAQAAAASEKIPVPVLPGGSGVEHLGTAECWRLLQERSFGRLAVAGVDGLPDVFPLNYTVHEECIYIRTARGSKLLDIARRPVAAFEIDGEDESSRWSVVVRGSARRLDIDAQIRASGVLALVSASPTAKHDVIRITPASVSGRRFQKRPAGSAHEPHASTASVRADPHQTVRRIDTAVAGTRDRRSEHGQPPHPIPSFPPLATS
ncbi:MAG: pyridoxamine 5'-phosphate oxidase family protein [Microbacterium sp.]